MLKKSLTLTLIGALLFSFIGVSPITAKTKEEKAAELAAKVKHDIAKLGTGPDARLEVKLRDKTKLKGYVSQVGAESFVVTDATTGVETEVAYPNVTKATGKNLSKGAWIAIGVTAAVVAAIAWYVHWQRTCASCN